MRQLPTVIIIISISRVLFGARRLLRHEYRYPFERGFPWWRVVLFASATALRSAIRDSGVSAFRKRCVGDVGRDSADADRSVQAREHGIRGSAPTAEPDAAVCCFRCHGYLYLILATSVSYVIEAMLCPEAMYIVLRDGQEEQLRVERLRFPLTSSVVKSLVWQ